jgi:RNA 2',3'-cyclic 3'-phosphodiesterase
VAGDGRIRLFCALQLPPAAIGEVEAWQREHLHGAVNPGAAGGRIVPPANLHVTLAFLGSRPADEVPAIAGALAEEAAAAGPVQLRPVGYRETRSVGMIVCEDVTGAATELAAALQERFEQLGAYRRETRPWRPHVTVLRFKDRPGLSLPGENIRSIDVVRAALYASVLRPSGAQYDVLETVALGGR